MNNSCAIFLQVDKDASNTELSADDVSALDSEMSKLAASLVGEVMVLEIAQKVGSWLAWKAKDRGPRFGSFYEQMEADKVSERFIVGICVGFEVNLYRAGRPTPICCKVLKIMFWEVPPADWLIL